MNDDELLLSNFNVLDCYKSMTVDDIRAANMEDRLPFAVCTINLNGNLNIGMIIRTASLMGAERVLVFGKRKYDRRSCVGSHNYLPIERISGYESELVDEFTAEDISPELFHSAMARFGYTPVFVEQGGIDISSFDVSMLGAATKPCLVFGCESSGIPQQLIDSAKHIVSIPQRGVMRSLNVSSAASIAMWEIAKKVS